MEYKRINASYARQMIKERFGYLMDEGFQFHSSVRLVRVRDLLVQDILFKTEGLNNHMYLVPSVQILVDNHDDFSVTMGTIMVGAFIESPEKEEAAIRKFDQQVREEILPFMNATSDLSSIADPDHRSRFRTFLRESPTMWTKCCYIWGYLGKKRDFLEHVEDSLRNFSVHPGAWAKEEYRVLASIRDALDDPEKLREIYRGLIGRKVRALKLEKFLPDELRERLR